MERYIDALLREAACRKELMTEPVETVYIGGGTPSVLAPDLMKRLLTGIKSELGFDAVKEFTVEANPGTVTRDWLDLVRSFGVNRISFGVQSTQDALLQTLGRIHRYADVLRSVDEARRSGFSNINIDLMFGIPGQTADDWYQTLNTVLSLSPEHISAYGLIPEEGTSLFRDLENGSISLPDPDEERRMYDMAISMLSEAGFQQYEISNFARPDYECRHNIGYWDQIPYIGLGLSAASMIRFPRENGICFSARWTNPRSFHEYEEMIGNSTALEKIRETVSADEARFETVMLSLRMTAGMRRSRFRELHGDVPEHWYGDTLFRLRDQGLLELYDDCWRLTRRGMDIQNSVLVEFMDQ